MESGVAWHVITQLHNTVVTLEDILKLILMDCLTFAICATKNSGQMLVWMIIKEDIINIQINKSYIFQDQNES